MASRRPLAALLCLALAASPAAAEGFSSFASAGAGDGGWQESLTPHFDIHHQTAWLPSGLTMGVEKVHFRLEMDLGMFSSWPSKGRINFYLYKDLASYEAGEFHPPAWSNGLAIYDRNAVAIPAMKKTSQILRVFAHETTHLVFVNYFHEAHRDPPNWLNEGLAMLEEAPDPNRPQASQWYQSMVVMDPAKWFPMDEFFATSPIRDLGNDKARVAVFYIQAYSIVHFLVRRHSHLQFKAFCAALRDGKSAPEALRLVYHYRTTAEFEKRWRQWLADPVHSRRVAALTEAERVTSDGVIDHAGGGFGLRGSLPHGFSSGWEFKTRSVFPTKATSPASGN
jgi:hypothetical protein